MSKKKETVENASKERVNHPSYYELGDGSVECIDLLCLITEGYSGIAAGDIMQNKYAYRAGNKTEEGINNFAKAVEDWQKCLFYMKDFQKRANDIFYDCIIENDSTLPDGFRCTVHKNPIVVHLVAHEFAKNKAPAISRFVEAYISQIMEMQTFDDIAKAISLLEQIIDKIWPSRKLEA